MINNIIDEFRQILNQSDWIDSESKKVALGKVTHKIFNFHSKKNNFKLLQLKVNAMDAKIAYSEKILNSTYLDNQYNDVFFYFLSF